MKLENFERDLRWFDRSSLDPEFCRAFGETVDAADGPGGGPLRTELEECVQDFNYLRCDPSYALSTRRYRLLGVLRRLVARAAVEHLDPDLVILDEFQRFKDLLDGSDDEGAQLAHAIFDHEDAKVLLLSATPYKMYTLPDEPEGDDHYRDFVRTTTFLAGEERARVVEGALRTMRETLVAGGDIARARDARDRVEHELRRVMRFSVVSATSMFRAVAADRPGARSSRSRARAELTSPERTAQYKARLWTSTAILPPLGSDGTSRTQAAAAARSSE